MLRYTDMRWSSVCHLLRNYCNTFAEKHRTAFLMLPRALTRPETSGILEAAFGAAAAGAGAVSMQQIRLPGASHLDLSSYLDRDIPASTQLTKTLIVPEFCLAWRNEARPQPSLRKEERPHLRRATVPISFVTWLCTNTPSTSAPC